MRYVNSATPNLASSPRTTSAASVPAPAFSEQEVADVCASFQRAVVEALVDRTFDAARWLEAKSVGIAGGVSANSRLRQDAIARGERAGLPVFVPSLALTTDNAAMIAAAGLRRSARRHHRGHGPERAGEPAASGPQRPDHDQEPSAVEEALTEAALDGAQPAASRRHPAAPPEKSPRLYPSRPIVGVGAVIIDDGRVVLIKRRYEPLAGQWSLPGGTLDVGETLEAGVRARCWRRPDSK